MLNFVFCAADPSRAEPVTNLPVELCASRQLIKDALKKLLFTSTNCISLTKLCQLLHNPLQMLSDIE